jgi:hypothetical protein
MASARYIYIYIAAISIQHKLLCLCFSCDIFSITLKLTVLDYCLCLIDSCTRLRAWELKIDKCKLVLTQPKMKSNGCFFFAIIEKTKPCFTSHVYRHTKCLPYMAWHIIQ